MRINHVIIVGGEVKMMRKLQKNFNQTNNEIVCAHNPLAHRFTSPAASLAPAPAGCGVLFSALRQEGFNCKLERLDEAVNFLSHFPCVYSEQIQKFAEGALVQLIVGTDDGEILLVRLPNNFVIVAQRTKLARAIHILRIFRQKAFAIRHRTFRKTGESLYFWLNPPDLPKMEDFRKVQEVSTPKEFGERAPPTKGANILKMSSPVWVSPATPRAVRAPTMRCPAERAVRGSFCRPNAG